jgi:hypothetical protein
MNIEEQLNTEPTQEIENPISNVAEEDPSEPSLVDKIYTGEIDYKSLDKSTKNTVLKEAYSRLTEEQQYLWDQGWRAKPFFIGKDKNGNEIVWKNEEEFSRILKRPHVAKERESHLIQELKKSKEEIERLKNITKMNMERNLENDEVAINAEIERAKFDLDSEGLEKAIIRKAQLKQNKEQVKQYYEEAPPPSNTTNIVGQLAPEDSDALLNFRADNAWYGNDPVMSQFAYKEFVELNNLAPNKSFSEKLNLVQKRTMAAFPSKFTKSNTNNFMPTTNTTNNAPLTKFNTNKVEEVYNKLPTRDKERVANLIASGKFSSKEAVLKNYGLI